MVSNATSAEWSVPTLLAVAGTISWGAKLYFATGHTCDFSGLHYPSAFIGFPEFYLYTSAALLILNTTFASMLSLHVQLWGVPPLIMDAACRQGCDQVSGPHCRPLRKLPTANG